MANTNFFSKSAELRDQKKKAREAHRAIIRQEEKAREEYLDTVVSLMMERPGLSAEQYASMMTSDPSEQLSIITSISMMGYMALACRKGYRQRGYYGHEKTPLVCEEPSIPSLTRSVKTHVRHFIEVDDAGNPIGKFDEMETKFVYDLSDGRTPSYQ